MYRPVLKEREPLKTYFILCCIDVPKLTKSSRMGKVVGRWDTFQVEETLETNIHVVKLSAECYTSQNLRTLQRGGIKRLVG